MKRFQMVFITTGLFGSGKIQETINAKNMHRALGHADCIVTANELKTDTVITEIHIKDLGEV